MTLKSTTFRKSIRLKPDADTILSEEGTLKVDSGDNKLKAYLGAAIRSLVSEDQSQTLTNKTIDADNNTISNLEVDNLKSGVLNTSTSLTGADNLQIPSALAVKTYADNTSGGVQTNLDNHLNDTTDAHDASAISNSPSGNLAATDVQAALNELQGDIDTNATNISNHISDTTDAHDASAISVVPTGNLAADDVQEALQELQGDIDSLGSGKVTGPGSATDNAVARFDLTTGKIIQNSSVIIDDSNNVSGMATLTLDNLYFDQNTIENSLSNTDLNFNTQGSGQIVSQKTTRAKADVTFDITTDSTTTGADATLVDPATKIIRLTNASLASVAMIPAGLQGQQITIINHTGAIVTIKDNTGGTAANRILTGQKASISLKDEASLILEYDSTESRWMVIGGTGSGDGSGINYITNSDIEAGVTGYVTYADAAGVNPVDGTGGSPVVTVTATTTTPLRGAQSLLFTKDAANRQGQGFSFDFTIANADKNQLLDINFEYEIPSGTYASGDMGIFIYDVTNATLIQPLVIDIPGSTGTARFQSQFQSTSSTSYRLIAHVRTTSASAYTLEVDTVRVSPSQSFVGTITTPWVAYSPTIVSFGTVTNLDMYYRRVGDSIEIMGSFTSGTATGVEARIPYPSGIVPDSLTYAQTKVQGRFARNSASATVRKAGTLIVDTNSYFRMGSDDYTNALAPNTGLLGNNTANSGDTIFITMPAIKVQGWTAANAATQGFGVVPIATYVRATAQSISNITFTTLLATTQFVDTTNSYNTSTGLYTVPEAGTYRIEATTLWSSSPSSQSILRFQRNGGFVGVPQASDRSYDGANAHLNMNGFVIVQCAKGDTLNAQVYQSSGGSINVTGSVYISRIDKNMFGMNQRVAARAVQTSGQSIPNTGTPTLVTWDTVKTFDTNGAFNSATGTFTAPVDGDYRVTSQLLYINPTWTVGNGANIIIYKNGTAYSRQILTIQATIAQLIPLIASDLIRLNAGDTVQIYTAHDRTGGAVALSTTTGCCFVAISKEN